MVVRCTKIECCFWLLKGFLSKNSRTYPLGNSVFTAGSVQIQIYLKIISTSQQECNYPSDAMQCIFNCLWSVWHNISISYPGTSLHLRGLVFFQTSINSSLDKWICLLSAGGRCMCWRSVWEEVLNNIKMEKGTRWNMCVTCLWRTCQARVFSEVHRLSVKNW